MSMNKILVFVMSLLAAAALSACRGEEGPMGPQGPQGVKGDDGSVNMVSYNYTVKAADWTGYYSEGVSNPDYFYHDITDENLTSNAVENGMVAVYLYTGDYVQKPLPVSDYYEELDENGEKTLFEEMFDFDVYDPDEAKGEVGSIRLYFKVDDFTLGSVMPSDYTFRVVIMWP